MERESAVREILQSIGPLFPEDAQRAREARRQARQDAEALTVAEAPAEQAPRIKLTTAPKPVLASQVDAPNIQKTQVANLAAVLERLVPPPPAPSVRDTVPELVRAAPDVNALRAALGLRQDAAPAVSPTTAVEPEPIADPAPVAVEAVVEPILETVVEAAPVESVPELDVTPFVDPMPAVEPELAFEMETVVEPAPVIGPASESVTIAAAEPAAGHEPHLPLEAEPEAQPVQPHFSTFSEDDHDAFVAAVAEALQTARDIEAPPADRDPPAAEPDAEVVAAVAETPAAEPKAKVKRAKAKKEAKPAPEPEAVPTVAGPETGLDFEPTSFEDDELIRQIKTHRADMIDVDDQLAALDQQIAAEKAEMAHYVALVEQKNAHRARLVRLRTSTQRFVDTLQVRAEPVKRQPKEKKSA